MPTHLTQFLNKQKLLVLFLYIWINDYGDKINRLDLYDDRKV